jgi:hypothetical protein
MKRSAHLLTPPATRLAVLTIAMTLVLGTPMTAKSNGVHNNNVSHSAPQRPAAPTESRNPATAHSNFARPAQTSPQRTATPPRPNTAMHNNARPQATRPNAARPNTARSAQPNTSRPNTAHANHPQSRPAQSNVAHANHPNPNVGHPNPAPGNASHGFVASGGGSGHADGHGAGHADALHGGRQIPDARFQTSFGRSHAFHIGRPIMVGGQASFQYGGLWFGIVDPWPAGWLYTDAVYVDFIAGGYVLVDVVHPGVQVAVSVGDAASTCISSSASPAGITSDPRS